MEAEQKEEDLLQAVQDGLDLLFTRVGGIENSQQQLAAQLEIMAKAVNQSNQDQLILNKQLKATGEAVSRLNLWRMKLESGSDSALSDAEDDNPFGSPDPGSSSRPPPSHPHRAGNASPRPFLPKMSVPNFDGHNPCIWKDKCEEYFRLYNIPVDMKTSAASLHLEGNAAKWYQVFKVQNGLVEWNSFISAVEAKIGVHDYRNALSELLDLKQTSTVDEYTSEFEAVRFQVSMHNPGYDDLFFTSHFTNGLKEELRGVVQSQVPETVERASLLARVQQQVLDQAKHKSVKAGQQIKPGNFSAKYDLKLGPTSSSLWRERQLRDYRKANNLCFFCGEKFDSEHLAKCTKRTKSQLNALALNDLDVTFSEETLNQLEIEDVLT